jgi:Ca2+-binding EF-hand superfamily protein
MTSFALAAAMAIPAVAGETAQKTTTTAKPAAQAAPAANPLDLNHDGLLSRSEYGGSPSSFVRLDINGDGQLDAAELKKAEEADATTAEETEREKRDHKTAADARFTKMDADHDGRLTREEWPYSDRTFASKDKNGDHYITPDELKAKKK